MRALIIASSFLLLILEGVAKTGEKEFIEATKQIPCFMMAKFVNKNDYRILLNPKNSSCVKDEMIQVYKKGLKMMCDSRSDFGLANRQFTITIFDIGPKDEAVATEVCK